MAAFCASTAHGASVYEVPETRGEVVGAWDGNIFADDVGFEVPSLVRMVRLRLAIAGVQTCRLWIFEELDAPPVYVATFTNAPATNQYDVATYDFAMRLHVPRRIYVGFSAQGGGWGANGVDYWSRGFAVNRGVAQTPGTYYYGTVAGGRLTETYAPGDGSFGCMQILAEPARIAEAGVDGDGLFRLRAESLPIRADNRVVRGARVGDAAWEECGVLPEGEEDAEWSGPSAEGAGFYRIESR